MKMMNKTKKITIVAMLSAAAAVLMFFEFSVPLMPAFIKLDFSELPAIIAACTMGPISGIAVCFLKNLIHLTVSTTGGIGELSNFILGVLFVVPAGLICKKINGVKGAVIGSVTGALVMAAASVLTNYYIVYPAYTIFMPMEAIINSYRVINNNIDTLFKALVVFNMPFTFIKGLCSAAVLIVVRKPLFYLLKKEKIV